MNICILVYFSLYVIIFSRRTNFLALSLLELSTSKFTILTKNSNDGSKIDENDSSKYDTVNNGSGIRYKFKSKSKCVGLNYDNKPIWTYDSNINGENYPLEISLNSYSNSVRVKTKNRLYIYSYRNGNWDLIFESEVASDPLDDAQVVTQPDQCLNPDSNTTYYSEGYFDPNNKLIPNDLLEQFVNKLTDNGIQIITLDDYYKTKINDIGIFYVYKNNNSTLYRLRMNKIWCEIKYKGEVLWRDKSSGNEVDYPRVLYIYTDNEVICFDLTCKQFRMYPRVGGYLRHYEKCVLQNEVSTPFLIIKKMFHWPEQESKKFYLKIKYEDSSESGNTVDLEIVVHYQGVLRHKFKKGQKCIEITSKNITIWKHDPRKDGENYPTEVYFDLCEKRNIKIKLANRTYLYSHLDTWVFEALYINQPSENKMGNSLNKLLDNLTTNTTNENGNDVSLIDSSVYP